MSEELKPPAGLGPVEHTVGRPPLERADLCMLALAADAIGLEWEWHPGCGDALHLTGKDSRALYWNPLLCDADALRLAVRMEMDLFVRAGRWSEAVRPMGPVCRIEHGDDPMAATRRAIVMAATARVRHMPPGDDWRAKPHQPLPDRRKPPNVGSNRPWPQQEQR